MTTRHADFEALSAYADGEAPEWADHVGACAACQASVDRIRAVAAAVGEPVIPPPAAGREAAIAAALAGAGVRPGAVAGPAPAPAAPPDRFASRRRRARGPWALPAVAAVVIGLLGFSGLILSSGRSSDNDTTAVAGGPLAKDARSGAESGVAAAAPAVPPSDLGDIPDAATLRSRAQVGVTAGRSSSSAAATDTAGPPVALTPTTTLTQRAATPSVAGTRPCEENARAREPALRELVYFATGRRGLAQAYVLGFATGTPGSPVTLLVLAQDGCAELLRAAGS